MSDSLVVDRFYLITVSVCGEPPSRFFLRSLNMSADTFLKAVFGSHSGICPRKTSEMRNLSRAARQNLAAFMGRDVRKRKHLEYTAHCEQNRLNNLSVEFRNTFRFMEVKLQNIRIYLTNLGKEHVWCIASSCPDAKTLDSVLQAACKQKNPELRDSSFAT